MAHPFLDRRDLTRRRDAARAPASGGPDPMLDLAAELAEQRRLLERLLTAERADIAQLCVTDRDPAEAAMANFPVPGARRLIVRRTGQGSQLNLTANVPKVLVDANEARLGGTVVVSGAGAVILALTEDLAGTGGAPLTVGPAQLWLAGNGGSWDFRLSGLLWCGSVTAIAAAATTVVIAEV